MKGTTLAQDARLVCEHLAEKTQRGERFILGIAGPPASGKSTLAGAVVQALNAQDNTAIPKAALLPMDGFHLDNRILAKRNLLARKGASETFNAAGFCREVQGLATSREEAFVPVFDRERDLAIANAIAVHPETGVIVVEGNYLLLKTQPWASLASVFDLTVFVSPTLDQLRDRLVQRWLSHGLDAEAALHRASSNDLPNAALVLAQSQEADLVLDQDYREAGGAYAY